MRPHRKTRVGFVVVTLAAVALTWSAHAQDAAPPTAAVTQPAAPPTAPAPTPAVTAPVASPKPADITFTFKGATWDQVLDFFARATGLPVVREVPAPDGVVDFLSPKSYALPDALQTLNILLQTRGVMLRVEKDKLYLQKLDDMKRENVPTFTGTLPDTVTDDQIVTLVLPLRTAAAKPVAEELAKMVAAYGSVSALEKQNALVIVETAAQVRRLVDIVSALDKEDVENVVEYLPLKHAKATEMVASLTALMGERVIEYVINPQNNQKVKLEENRLGGMTIAADPRTNAIVARGTRAKIDQLKETIKLLDVPGLNEGRAVRSFTLRRLVAPEVVAQLTQLFATQPAKDRPTVIAAGDGRRVLVVGDERDVAEASALIGELDGTKSGGDSGDNDTSVAIAALANAAPEAVAATVKAMLGRDASLIAIVPGADGRSVVVSGPPRQVEAVRGIVAALDRSGKSDRQVRVVRVAGADPAALFERAKQLHATQVDPTDGKADVSATFEPGSRSAVLVGESAALSKFAAVLEQLAAVVGPQPDVRLIALEHAKAADVAAYLAGIAQSPLGAMVDAAAPGAPKPAVEPIERTNTLLIAAQPAQHQVIATLVKTLDVPTQTNLPPLRILQLRSADAANLATTLTQAYAKRTTDEKSAKPVSVSADPQTNALLVAAHPDLLPEIERIVEELNNVDRVVTEGREIRIFPLKVARAVELAKTIDEMFPPPPVPVDPRGRPRPELQKPREVIVRGDAQTNALIVDAPVQRMAGFEELVRSLDQQEIGADTEIRTWRLDRADANAAAEALRQLAASGSLGGIPANRRSAVTVSVEPGTRTLVVSGPREIFPKVDEVLKGLDADRAAPSTTLRFFKLNVAKAESVAPMLREILAGRIAEEIPGTPAELQALLRVTADRKSNTLIISAPEAVMSAAEALVQQLDSTASAGGEPVIRVRPLTFASAGDVASSLTQAMTGMTSRTTNEPLAVRITPSTSANALILVGPEEDLKDVEQLIEPLDSRPATDAVDAKTFELRFAEASRIAPLVQNILADQQETDPRIVLERLRRSRGQIDTTPRVRVEADSRTNRLIVSGPQRTVALAETLIAELDRADAAGDRTMATFTPTNADTTALIATVKQVIESTRPAGQRSTLQVIPEAQSGALLLMGAKSEVDEASALMKRIDGQTIAAPGVDLRLIALTHSDAKTIAPAIAGLLQDRTRWPERLRQAAKAGVAIGEPAVLADPTANRLLVSAPTELIPLAEKLVAELDRPSGQGSVLDVRTFSLATADAKGVADAIRSALDARAASRPGEPKAFVAAEPSSNAVVVTASPEQLTQVEALVETLESGTPRDQAQVRTIFLRNGRAAQVAPLVESLLTEQELIDPKALPPWAQAEYARTRAQLRGNRPEVRVAADERLNAVVIAAPAAVLDAAEQMVAQLDVAPQPGGDGRSVRLLTLRNADAAEVATALEPIFADEKDREKPPTIRVNAASNALLVRASDAQFATLERVVSEIDQATMATSRQMRTIPLDAGKASARDVAEMLKRLLGGDGDGVGGGGPTVEVITLDELLEREKARGTAPPKKTSFAVPSPACGRGSGEAGGEGGVATCCSRLRDRGGDVATPPSPGPSGHPLPQAGEGRTLAALFASVILAADSVTTAPPKPDTADATIAVDERTNSLVIVGSPRTVERLAALAKQAQEQVPSAPVSLHVITLDAANDPERLRTLLGEMLEKIAPAGGKPGDLNKRVALLADPALNALVIAASDADFRLVSQMLAAVGRAPVAGDAPVRTITLERAQATGVATAIQRFFDERSRMVPAPRGQRDRKRIVVVGDPTSNTLLVAANDDDFAQVQSIVKTFDSPQAASALEMRIFPLKHARASEIERTIQFLVNDLTWGQSPFMFFGQRSQQDASRRDTVAVRAEPRLNALIVTGTGDKFQLVERIVDAVDAPTTDASQRLVRLYPIRNASSDIVAEIARDIATGGRERRPWEDPDRSAPRVRLDPRTRQLVVVGTESQQEEIAGLLAALDRPAGQQAQRTEVVRVEFARASDLADVLSQFLQDRAASAGAGEPTTTIVPSDSANSLLLAGSDDEIATLRDLLVQLDQPGTGGDRRIEIVTLRDAKADELARMLQQQFPRGGGGGRGQGGAGVIVTPDIRTNVLVVNAPSALFAQVKALIERLDAKPLGDVTVIRTYALKGARAEEAARLLGQTLALDANGETEGAVVRLDESDADPVQVRARVVADRRSNSLVVTATPESFPVIEALINRIDEIPARSPVEYRIVRLQHVLADEVSYTLRQVIRAGDDEPAPRIDWNIAENQLVIGATADQFEQIEKILAQIDQPSERRRQTDFVPLKFAQAENVREALQYFYGPGAIDADTPGRQSVVIVADPAANSLVISADEGEWEGIRAIVSKLDSEDYDASQQLRVFALLHADASAVARAINEAFQGRFERRGAIDAARRGQPAPGAGGPNDDPRQSRPPAMLVEGNEWVNAAPETETNSVIVAASRVNLGKIERIIETIDTPDYSKLPPPRLIPVVAGNPTQLAETLSRMFAPDPSQRGGAGVRGGRGLRIAGDVSTNTLLVRATDEEFAQVEALAQALQQQADAQGLQVKILSLKSAPAARVATAIREAFAAKAKQQNLPLSVSIDAAGNALVIASTGPIFEEIRETVEQMDRLAPAAGQAIFVIELEHISPDAAKNVIETIGLDKPQPEDSISRIVSEPVKVSLLPGRNALVVVASPGDRETIVGLLKAVDGAPELAESQVRIVRLKNAEASALAAVLGQILTPGTQQSSTPLAKAVAEQVRRLSVRRDGLNEPDVGLDLTKPIRIVPDPALNALVIASTEQNVEALASLVQTFDEVPVTDAVTVQIFPLENIAADQLVRIVKDLFLQGKALASRPGARTQGKVELVPAGTVGKALLDSIAISVDERTNTVIVAGKEDAVALVEVLVKRLDTEVAAGWVEPRVIPLRFADAEELATTLQGILTESGGASPNAANASPLQKQVARLRLMRHNGGQVPDAGTAIEADYFQPLTRTVIRSEPHMNALLVVATPANIDVVNELVKLLDVEAASPAASVRIYPVQHASAAKLATLVTRIFDQQLSAKAIRPEDKVAAQADERTNALVVSTSPRSFAVLEQLLKSLDAPVAPDFKEIRTIEVRHASAQRLANMIQQLMDARLERLRKVQPETADLEKVVVLPDQRNNAIVIAAGNDSFEVVKRLVADLDTENVVDSSLVQVIYLEKANADRIAAAVRSILDRRYSDLPPEVRQSQRPLVLVDQRSNSLMIAAAPDDFSLIADLVKKLEQAPVNPAVGVTVVALTAGRAEQLAPRLQTLLTQRRQSLGEAATPGDMVSIQADPGTNSLIVAASDENLQVVRQLVQVLGEAERESGGQQVEVIALTSSRATDLVPVVQEMYVAEENRRRGPNSVRVAAEQRINALLVTGDAGDVAAIKSLVARLDGAKPESVIEIKYVALSSANAVETVALLENILGGRSIVGRGGRAATVLKYFRTAIGAEGENDDVETEVSTAIRESINLTPDIRTNTIIVSAPRDSMAMIEKMIRDLDSSTTGSQSIRVFKLTNADAEAMADILKTLFRMEQRGDLLVLKPREPQGDGGAAGVGGAAGGGGGAGTDFGPSGISGVELTAVPDERQQLSITIDSRTNSLLVSATPTYLDLVEKVVLELDAQPANERETNIYRLKNAVAAEVAQVVSQFVEEDQRKLVETLGSDQLPSAARLLEREVTIVGDEKSNTVLINASPRYMARVEDIIRELDVDPPQVLIQVLLAEIALDSSTETGVNLFASGQIGEYTVGGGYGLANVLATSVGVPLVPFNDIPFFSVAGPNFDLLIKALQSQGRLQVLSNPSVMAANNEPADIQVGETVRLPDSVSIAAGQQQSAVTPEDIGIILKVTPSINPDGFVRMEINPEISELSKRTTQISETFQSPVITRRKANTTVTVRDGETIVLGGLISDRFERRTNKVPFIGDIPLLGLLFRSDVETVAKTELMIVLTPHVIMPPSQLQVQRIRELTDEQIERLALPEWLKKQLRRAELDGFTGLYDDKGQLIESGSFQQPDPRNPKYDDMRGPRKPMDDTDLGDGP